MDARTTGSWCCRGCPNPASGSTRAALRVLGREIIGHCRDESGGEHVTRQAPLSDAVAFNAYVLSASADEPSVASRQIGFIRGPASCFSVQENPSFDCLHTLVIVVLSRGPRGSSDPDIPGAIAPPSGLAADAGLMLNRLPRRRSLAGTSVCEGGVADRS